MEIQNTTQDLSSPSVADVERIRALADPVLRNLQITQCYHELSAVMAGRTGPGANWCTFATWASKQAGQTIRREDLARTLESAFGDSTEVAAAVEKVILLARQIRSGIDQGKIKKMIREAVGPGAVIDRTSDAVARGNRKVFEEIGREFARFIATCVQDEKFDPDRIEEFCAEFRPGEPPDGQRYLSRAFSHYYQAFFETEVQPRAELLFLANLEIGFHEQTRLQPEIAESLDAALINSEMFKNRLIADIFPYGGLFVRARLFIKRLLGRPATFEIAVNQLIATIRRRMHLAITEHLMTLTLFNTERLRLGVDLQKEFPASLKKPANTELLELLALADPTPDSLLESGAVDWADLPDRLHFIVDLFRCYHETKELHDPPFTNEQLNEIQSGRLPGGRL
ncbi:MAG: hypothetical protein IPM66_22825 [Acidobacteriota bacterium]|nr:MAG: hypothetical protein IPM66_22825 [Acidobacteriota bacterium]